jgi:site-specific recombinase XerD
LINSVEEQIGDFLTVTNTRKVTAILSDALADYDVEEISTAEVNTDLLLCFLNAKRIEGRSEKTIARYSYLLEKAILSMGVSPDRVTTDHVRAYLMDEKRRGMSDRSLEGLRSVLSSFFGWLWKDGKIKINPVATIGNIKYQKKIRTPFTDVEIEKLKDACTNIRDKTLVCFLLSTGARIGEVCALNRSDVDLKNLECTVLGKGNKERTVFINPVTAMMLQKYLSERDDDNEALFVSYRDHRLDGQSVRWMLKELEQRTGVENVHPHRFRRTLATNLINHGMPIQEVSVLLGHESINTTMTYVFIDKVNVKNSYRKYS